MKMGIKWKNKNVEISAETFCNRKRPAICVTVDGFTMIYGYFNDNASAYSFISVLARSFGAAVEAGERE